MPKIYRPLSTITSMCLLLLCFTVVMATNSIEPETSDFFSENDSLAQSAFYAPLTEILYQVIFDEINFSVQVGIKSLNAINFPDSAQPFLQLYHSDGKIDILPYARIHTPEAIAITLLDYEQTPIDTIKQSGLTQYFPFVPGSQPNNSIKYPEDTIIYQLRFSILLSLIDIEQKTIIDAAVIEAADVGHNKRDGSVALLKHFENQARIELRRFFSVFSTLPSQSTRKFNLMLGKNFGLQKGTVFEIFTPHKLAADTSISLYKPSGILSLDNVYEDSSTALIQRKWGRIDSTSLAILANTQPPAFIVSYSPRSVSNYTNFSINAAFQPFSPFSWRVGGHYHQIRDSYNHLDHGFGVQVGGRFALCQTSKFTLAAQTDLFLDFFFRDDDFGYPVSAIVPGIAPSVYGSCLLAPHIDLIVGLGYRYAHKTDSWVVNSEDEAEYKNEEASWISEASPHLKYSGLFFSCGFRFLIF